ncbi:uncharacterized protein LOC112186362 [Rosa chinensis]|uniref:uncharacterized protein LOC112186362 n=1 Tax=Rosa chinensis TaxID=74649 RepID=UPI001AD9488F|nr:uncharacterized protein LOC112186362 [Rosa chinensis]
MKPTTDRSPSQRSKLQKEFSIKTKANPATTTINALGNDDVSGGGGQRRRRKRKPMRREVGGGESHAHSRSLRIGPRHAQNHFNSNSMRSHPGDGARRGCGGDVCKGHEGQVRGGFYSIQKAMQVKAG